MSAGSISPRLLEVVDALPLRPGLRVLEIGCGPGVAARAVAERLTPGFVLATDRSAKAVEQARSAGAERLELEPGEEPFDLVFEIPRPDADGAV